MKLLHIQMSCMFKWVPSVDRVLASVYESHIGICELGTTALKTSHTPRGKKKKTYSETLVS